MGKILLRILTILLLLFNTIGAIYGGWSLMTVPDGSGLQLPLSLLESTSFPDFFIPGLVLFVANGVFSACSLFAVIAQWKYAWWLVLIQGILLTGWIIIQVLLIRTTFFLQLIFIIIGLAFLLIGIKQIRKSR